MKVCINGVWRQVKDETNPTVTTNIGLSSSIAFDTVAIVPSLNGTNSKTYGIPIKSGVSVGQKYLAFGSKLQTYVTGSNQNTQSGKDTIEVPILEYYEGTVTQSMINNGYFYVGSFSLSGSGQSTQATYNGLTVGCRAMVFLL